MDEIQWLKGKLSDQKRMGKSFLDKYYFWYNNDGEKELYNQSKQVYLFRIFSTIYIQNDNI